MKKNFLNSTVIEGKIYEATIEEKVTGPDSKAPGTPYLSGSVKVATDNAETNIIEVKFSYVSATMPDKKSKNPNAVKTNPNYVHLMSIKDGTKKTIMSDGSDNASYISINSSIGLNEWYNKDNPEELISYMVNDRGFIKFPNKIKEDEAERNTFDVDMLIKSAIRIEPDDENNTAEKMLIKGAVFNFAKELLPVEFVIYNTEAMDYFEGLDISSSNPQLMHIWGNQISTVVVKKEVVNAVFGSKVKETKKFTKEFVISGGEEPEEWGTETTLTNEELKKMIADREIHLATLKSAQEKRQQENASIKPVSNSASEADFDF